MASFAVFCVSFCLIMLCCQARYHHHHKKQKQHSHHPGSQISLPPSLPPEASPPSPDQGSLFNYTETFDVLVFGAIGDGVADDTEAFKTAWDAACQSDSAILLVPSGYSFMVQSTIFTGPCESGIVFQVDGTLMPPDGPENWPRNLSRRQWLVFYRADNMLMQGGGLIDGRGEQWWNLPCKPHKGANGTTVQGPCDSPVVSQEEPY